MKRNPTNTIYQRLCRLFMEFQKLPTFQWIIHIILNVSDFTHEYLDPMAIYGFPTELKKNISQEHKK